MDDQDERRRRAADNQAMFRSINERIEDLNQAFDQFGGFGRWTCECADAHCAVAIEMSMIEYEALREHPSRFAIAPGDEHLVADVEIVVVRNERYWIVEMVGAAGERATELSEREAPSSDAGAAA